MIKKTNTVKCQLSDLLGDQKKVWTIESPDNGKKNINEVYFSMGSADKFLQQITIHEKTGPGEKHPDNRNVWTINVQL